MVMCEVKFASPVVWQVWRYPPTFAPEMQRHVRTAVAKAAAGIDVGRTGDGRELLISRQDVRLESITHALGALHAQPDD